MGSQNIKTKIKQLKTKNSTIRVKLPHRFISSSTRKAGQQIHLNSKARTNKKIKNKTKTPQVAAEEHVIVDIPSKDTTWPKKMIR
jgi:hypothetical protein